MKNNTAIEINMGSSIIDFYMEGYDEGKNDNVQVIQHVSVNKKKTKNARASSRRKKTYFKAKNRMEQLSNVAHYVPAKKNPDVVFGKLRSHQLPIKDEILTFGCPIGDKKRLDTAEQKMVESLHNHESEDEVCLT
jgi:hypothetical protein